MKKTPLALSFALLIAAQAAAQCGQWQSVPSNTTQLLRAIHFPDAQNGWVVGSGGTLLHSADGGASWTVQTTALGAGGRELYSVHFTSATTGWVVGAGGFVKKTTDGGGAWTLQTTNTSTDLYDVFFSDANTGWIVGACGLILRTVNGGGQWTQIGSGQSYHLTAVAAANGSNVAAASSGAVLLQSSNGGANWSQGSGVANDRNFRALAFSGATGWAATNAGKVWKSTNGGAAWSALASPPAGAWHSASATGASLVWMAGLGGKLVRSTDGGTTWADFSDGIAAEDLYGLQMQGDNSGWTVGVGGVIFKYVPTAQSVSLLPPVIQFCFGKNALLDPGTWAAYAWSTGETTQTLSVLNPGEYSVTLTDVNGCKVADTVTVIRNPRPDFTATTAPTGCVGNTGTIMLNVTAGTAPYLYDWQDLTGPNDPKDRTGLGIGAYRVTVTDANNCSATATATIGHENDPNATPSPTPTRCGQANGAIALALSGGTAPFTFLWNNGSAQGQNPTNLLAGTYTVTIRDARNCETVASATVGASQVPTLGISGPSAVCAGVAVVLRATPGFVSYAWSVSGQVADSLRVTAAATYTATATDANNCIATATQTVSQTAAPTVTISGPTAFCPGLCTVLDAGANHASYQWSELNQTKRTLNVITAGTYTVTVSNAAGCTSSKSVAVQVHPAPTVALGSDLIFCAPGSVSLVAVAGNCTGCTYQWSGTAIQTAVLTVSPTAPIAYSVTVTDQKGCTASDQIKVSPQQAIERPVNAEICEGDSLVIGPTTFKRPGDYTVRLKTTAGCDSLVKLSLRTIQPEDFVARPDAGFLLPDERQAEYVILDNDDFPDNKVLHLIAPLPLHGKAEFDNQEHVVYTVDRADFFGYDTVRYQICPPNGCIEACDTGILVLFVQSGKIEDAKALMPNAITPNGDGFNDFFDPLALLEKIGLLVPVEVTEFTIVNRLGEVVFYKFPYERWDGRRNGQPLPGGTYYYLLRFGDAPPLKGPVTILR